MEEFKLWRRDELSRMRRDMDRLFDELCADFDLPVMCCRMTGDLHLEETETEFLARFQLGSINPDDVSVSVLDRRLIISAETVETHGKHEKKQTFRKELKLPCIIRTEDVKAEFVDGVLAVRLPKCPTQLGQSVEVRRK